MTFYYYPTCSTCKKAKKWLDDHALSYTERLIHEQTPTAEQLEQFWQVSQLPLKKFFNTSGLKYRELNLKTVLPELTPLEQLDLLASDGMLIKRPLLVTDTAVLVGFKADTWAETLLPLD
ncbi:MAG: arsenate reductase family protein [Culicoidibacterales bacterium]